MLTTKEVKKEFDKLGRLYVKRLGHEHPATIEWYRGVEMLLNIDNFSQLYISGVFDGEYFNQVEKAVIEHIEEIQKREWEG